MTEHLHTTDIPTHLPQTAAAVYASDDETLDELMALCAAEPAEPDTCLGCLAYLVMCERDEAIEIAKDVGQL